MPNDLLPFERLLGNITLISIVLSILSAIVGLIFDWIVLWIVALIFIVTSVVSWLFYAHERTLGEDKVHLKRRE